MADANVLRANGRLVLTAGLLGATLLAAVVTGTLQHQYVVHPYWLNRLGLVNGPMLRSWRVIKVIPTVAFTKGQGNVLGVTWKIVLFVGALEAFAGTRKAVLAFVATNIVGYLGAYLAIAWPLALAGHAWGKYWYHAGDVGASAGCYGAGIVLTQLLPPPWRWITLSGLLLYFATTLQWGRPLQIWDVEHLCALGIGLLIGLWWRRVNLASRGAASAIAFAPGQP